MKTAILFLLLSTFTMLGAATLLYQSFSSYPSFPTGWTRTGPFTSVWSVVNTSNAGGSAGELRFGWSPDSIGTYRFISPALDTRKVHNMTLSFLNYLDYYEYTTPSTIGVQISTDLSSWTTVWSVEIQEDLPPHSVNVNISFELGKSQNTYIAFVFIGNNFDIDGWYIDNVSLTYDNTLGDGIWPAGEYYPVGDLIIPDGYTLQLEAGAELYLYNSLLIVNGRILANGTASQNVLFSSNLVRDYWHGINFNFVTAANDSSLLNYAIIELCDNSGVEVNETDKVRFSNCIFRYNSTLGIGAGMLLYHSDVIIENCDFHDNQSVYEGSALLCDSSSPIIRNSRFFNNTSTNIGSTITFYLSTLSFIEDNVIANNTAFSNYPAVWLNGSNGTMRRNLIANNSNYGMYVNNSSVELINCDIVNNGNGVDFTSGNLSVRNSIIWGNVSSEIWNSAPQSNLVVAYSCIEDGIAGIDINGILPSNYINNTSSNPLFINPTTGTGTSYNALLADWHLQDFSPCIDSGDPTSPLNPDGSIEDMGMYYRLLKPYLTHAVDVYPDQGHYLNLKWNRNDLDETYNFNAFYSVWREGALRSNDFVYISDPSQITFGMVSDTPICWRDGSRTWSYIGQVPAVNDLDYEMTVQTLQDSSSTGTHEVDFIVRYHNEDGFWESIPKSGYSVDNIPPGAATDWT